jgi:hypothetical protein
LIEPKRSTDQITHQNVTRSKARGRGVTSRRTVIQTNRPALLDLASSSTSGLNDNKTDIISSLEAFEALLAAGNFDSVPPVDSLLDTFSPYLQDENDSSDSSPDLFGRIHQTIMRRLDEVNKQEESVKAAKKKRKETHSVTVCESVLYLFSRSPLLLEPRERLDEIATPALRRVPSHSLVVVWHLRPLLRRLYTKRMHLRLPGLHRRSLL